MFTGIVTAVGTVARLSQSDGAREVAIAAGFDPIGLSIGASVACAGICLTVTGRTPEAGGTAFTVDLGPETLALTTAAGWTVGTRVNLERALRIGDELGGHLVTGHIDGRAAILRREDLGGTIRFTFAAPAPLARFIAAKGSVALDGTSLTVNAVDGATFTCHLIPHTLAATTWRERREGNEVNLEIDLMARYAERLLARA